MLTYPNFSLVKANRVLPLRSKIPATFKDVQMFCIIG